MKNILTICILFLSLSTFAQLNKAPEALINCWSASFEEDKEKPQVKTFRLCDYKFPPARFRPTVKFNKDGTCQVLHLGATDIQSYEDCTWTYNKKKKCVIVTGKDNKQEMKFKISKVEKDVLKIVDVK